MYSVENTCRHSSLCFLPGKFLPVRKSDNINVSAEGVFRSGQMIRDAYNMQFPITSQQMHVTEYNTPYQHKKYTQRPLSSTSYKLPVFISSNCLFYILYDMFLAGKPHCRHQHLMFINFDIQERNFMQYIMMHKKKIIE